MYAVRVLITHGTCALRQAWQVALYGTERPRFGYIGTLVRTHKFILRSPGLHRGYSGVRDSGTITACPQPGHQRHVARPTLHCARGTTVRMPLAMLASAAPQ